LATGDVDDLNIFAGSHEIGPGRRPVDANFLQRISKRFGQDGVARRAQPRAHDVYTDRRGRVLRARFHWRSRGGDNHDGISADREVAFVSGAGVAAEHRDGAGAGKIDAAPLESGPDGASAFAVSAQDMLEAARLTIASNPENGRVDTAGQVGGHDFARLQALDVDQLDAIAGMYRDGDCPAPRYSVALFPGSEREQAGSPDGRTSRRFRFVGRLLEDSQGAFLLGRGLLDERW